MIDLAYLKLAAGNGGDGKVSYWRSRGITKGGPNGGQGGDGGDVILRAKDGMNTLQHLAGLKEFRAKSGGKGRKFRQYGEKGEDVVLEVPVGTVVWLVDENWASWGRRDRTGLKRKLKRSEVRLEKYFLEAATANPPPREKDEVTRSERRIRDFLGKEVEGPEAIYEKVTEGTILRLVELKEDGEEIVICQGGFGGRGNDAFKSATHQTPLEAEYGSFGEEKLVFLEARALADVGLVGFPNAGKSTLLAKMTKALPKIANYPFTTLEPQLGVINFGREQSIVMADLPGLIEGASAGKGLGFEFLRHVENCQSLLFVISLEEEVIYDSDLEDEQKVEVLWQKLVQLEREVHQYRQILQKKRKIVVVTKADLYGDTLRQKIEAVLPGKIKDMEWAGLVSAATGERIEELKKTLR